MAPSRPSAMKIAVQELKRGEKLMNSLQSHLHQPTQETHDLSEKVLQALATALALLKPKETDAELNNSTRSDKKRRQPVLTSDDQMINDEKDKKKRKLTNAWTRVTPVPDLDGHQWRKYGNKTINNFKHPRTYYRCTHRDHQGCLASKQVQQQEEDRDDAPPMFRVVYSNRHTCNNTGILHNTPQVVIESPPDDTSNNFFIFESKSSRSIFNNIMNNQEQFSPLNPKTEDPKESCPSLMMNLTTESAEVDLSNPVPLSPSWVQDYYGFDFDFESKDVDGFISLVN